MKTSLEAGNTNENLRGTDRDEAVAQKQEREGLPSAEDLDAVSMELEMAHATMQALDNEEPEVEYVTRAEYLDLLTRIDGFNSRSGHKI